MGTSRASCAHAADRRLPARLAWTQDNGRQCMSLIESRSWVVCVCVCVTIRRATHSLGGNVCGNSGSIGFLRLCWSARQVDMGFLEQNGIAILGVIRYLFVDRPCGYSALRAYFALVSGFFGPHFRCRCRVVKTIHIDRRFIANRR